MNSIKELVFQRAKLGDSLNSSPFFVLHHCTIAPLHRLVFEVDMHNYYLIEHIFIFSPFSLEVSEIMYIFAAIEVTCE